MKLSFSHIGPSMSINIDFKDMSRDLKDDIIIALLREATDRAYESKSVTRDEIGQFYQLANKIILAQ